MLSDLTKAISEFLGDLQVGEPWKLGDNKAGIVVPLSRKTSSQGMRDYVVLEEIKEKVIIEDLGSIDKVRMKSNSDKPVFVRGGGVLKGMSTQSRGIQFGVVILPDKEHAVPVLCVHASHGIVRGSAFTQHGYAPSRVVQAMQSEGQIGTWRSVSRWTRRSNSSNAARMRFSDGSVFALACPAAYESDNLVRTMDLFKTQIEEALRNIPADLQYQVGIALFSGGNVVGVEAFDNPASWLALSRSIVRQYKDVLDKEDTKCQPVNRDELTQKIKLFLEHARKNEAEEVYQNETSSTLLLKGEETIGEITLLRDKPIHILLTSRNAEPEHTEGAP